MSPSNECDRCGACCKTFPIYASEEDAIREPKIHSRSLLLNEWLGDERWRYRLHPLPFQEKCCFLSEGNLCAIYESRPSVCRAFEAGSPQCNEARARIGLEAIPSSKIK